LADVLLIGLEADPVSIILLEQDMQQSLPDGDLWSDNKLNLICLKHL